ncbi:peptide chain release factor N(5)-glutamine methyltransferase [Oscillospiraceae bacterium MB08-C2-2]|nr:peptide chain release factor N(5)-glutamine methyltransferase [Oscillospiraceae bacterium MB08-C2-2]
MVEPASYHSLYRQGQVLLASGGCQSYLFETDQLFYACFGKRRHDLPHIGRELAPPAQTERFLELCGKRAMGEPLQYLLGEWDFYGLTFSVGPGVLIPRPDTEVLVETAASLVEELPTPEIVDLCSGSGCVAAALANLLPSPKITAVESSVEAMVYLQKNLTRHGQGCCTPVLMDLREYRHPVPLDLVVANPPYIPSEDIAGLQKEVRKEPLMALDGGETGLDFYNCIACGYWDQLRPGGALCVEIGIGQAELVEEILLGHDYCNIGFARDLGGIQRVVWGFRPA